MMLFWKRPMEVQNLKPLSLFVFLFTLACERISIKHTELKIEVTGLENILFAGASVHHSAQKFYRLGAVKGLSKMNRTEHPQHRAFFGTSSTLTGFSIQFSTLQIHYDHRFLYPFSKRSAKIRNTKQQKATHSIRQVMDYQWRFSAWFLVRHPFLVLENLEVKRQRVDRDSDFACMVLQHCRQEAWNSNCN